MDTMTNEQRRIHRRLASAEKNLIRSIVFEATPQTISRCEQRVARHHAAWKRVSR